MNLENTLQDLAMWAHDHPDVIGSWDPLTLTPETPGSDETGWNARFTPQAADPFTLHIPSDPAAPIVCQYNAQSPSIASQ